MAKVYKNMAIYITDSEVKTKKYCGNTENLTKQEIIEKNDILNMTEAELKEKYGPAYSSVIENNNDEDPYEVTSEILDLPFLPEELEIRFDGNDAIEYLANGQFFTSKRKPQPKEIEISCFFPGKSTKRQINKGLNKTTKWGAEKWMEYFFNLMDEQRTINLCFTKWNFSFDCTVEKFYPKIQYAEIQDIYYTLLFREAADPKITPVLPMQAQGHNSWITAGEWQLVGGGGSISLEGQTAGDTAAATTTAQKKEATTPTTEQPKTDGAISKDSVVMIKKSCNYKQKSQVSLYEDDITSKNVNDFYNENTATSLEKKLYNAIESGYSFKVMKVKKSGVYTYYELRFLYAEDALKYDPKTGKTTNAQTNQMTLYFFAGENAVTKNSAEAVSTRSSKD